MAIAVAMLLGYRLGANFDFPYFSPSIETFWRRWHISLSSWLRDYLYISLGGNRRGIRITYRNLMLTMVLGGLWHGAGWTFVVWGTLHGAALAANKYWADRRRHLGRAPDGRPGGHRCDDGCDLRVRVFRVGLLPGHVVRERLGRARRPGRCRRRIDGVVVRVGSPSTWSWPQRCTGSRTGVPSPSP